MYVVFGIFLLILALALYKRLHAASPIVIRLATVIGFIWAGALMVSGMVSSSGVAPTV
jgi:hypothetical protein